MFSQVNCATDCPDIGFCCRVFYLGIRSSHSRKLIEETTPFEIIADIEDDVSYVAKCKNLQSDGMCCDYENRPETCKVFMPGKDNLCILFCGPPRKDTLLVKHPEMCSLRWNECQPVA